MKRGEAIRKIQREAKRQNIAWHLERQGANHEVYRLGQTMIPIPRHAELDNLFVEAVWKECEPELGERWWRR